MYMYIFYTCEELLSTFPRRRVFFADTSDENDNLELARDQELARGVFDDGIPSCTLVERYRLMDRPGAGHDYSLMDWWTAPRSRKEALCIFYGLDKDGN